MFSNLTHFHNAYHNRNIPSSNSRRDTEINTLEFCIDFNIIYKRTYTFHIKLKVIKDKKI